MSWKTVALGDVCDITGGGTPSKSNPSFYVGDIPWATVRDMNKDYLEETGFKIGKEAVKESSTNIIPKNNVIIATRVGLGKVCILKQDTAINQDLRGVVPKNPKVLDVNYLFFWFKSISKVIVDAGRGATVHGVTLPFIKSLRIPLPPISTQQKIVAKLDAIFAEIDKATAAAEANARNAEALFQSYLNEIFERGGEDWNTYAFDVIVEDKQIGLVKNSKEQLEDGEFAYFKMNNILNNNKCDLRILARVNATKEELTKFRLVKNDFLFNTRNSTELVGKVCVFEGEERDNILYNNNIMRVRFKPFVSSKYIHQAFSYKKIKAELEKLKTGTTNVAAIYYKDLKNLKLSIPSITQQNSILISLEKLDAITEGIKKQRQKKINELIKLKQSILRQAFAGELVKE